MRSKPWLLAFGLLAGAVLIYLGVSLTSPTLDPIQPDLHAPAGPLEFTRWDERAWSDAAARPSLVLLLVGDSLSPRTAELESRLDSNAALHSAASSFRCIQVDRRARPDLAERYAEGQVPHLSVLLPTGEALARITGDPDSWTTQLVESDRYWKDHQGEIEGRREAFWAKLDADSLSAFEPAAAPDVAMLDSLILDPLEALLSSDSPGSALWRTDFDRYLACAGHSPRAVSVWAHLKDVRAQHIHELGPALMPDATPAEWARTVLELRQFEGAAIRDSALAAVLAWFHDRGGPATAEEAALCQELSWQLHLATTPRYPGSWLGLDAESSHSLPHLESEPALLNGYLMDDLAWLEVFTNAKDAAFLTNAQRLGDSLWTSLWDANHQALRDKPVAASSGPRETAVFPRAQLGRLAKLFDRLSRLTGEKRFAARADSCLEGFAPYARSAQSACTYYAEALLSRLQLASGSRLPADSAN